MTNEGSDYCPMKKSRDDRQRQRKRKITMDQGVKRVVIVGGGSAGWITAGLLAAEHGQGTNAGLHITLLESANIPIIGVGEGTWPSMRTTLQKIGVAETDFLRECDASFKQGTQFDGWRNASKDDRYFHPFSLPAEYSSINLANYWLSHGRNASFADFVTPQAAIASAGKGPKQTGTPEFAFNVNYGYHFDAGKFATFLQRHVTTRLGVMHQIGDLSCVERAENGDIAELILADGARIAGDLFVDCTGQKALLISGEFGVDLVSVKDTLFNDRAIAVQVPYEEKSSPIASTTRATAQSAGWVWDIGLQTRRGIGYVHSSAHVDSAAAHETLYAYLKDAAPHADRASLTFREIDFVPGYREKFWVNNCLAVGLSAGFIEPLEASALALVEQSANILCEHFPRNAEVMNVVAKRFNEKLSYHWQSIIEFLKLHYVISQRDDSDYWREARSMQGCPQRLQEKIQLWQQQPPWHDDAPRIDELFPSASYQYVLYGMGFSPKYTESNRASYAQMKGRAEQLLSVNRDKIEQMSALLPTNRALITSMLSAAQ